MATAAQAVSPATGSGRPWVWTVRILLLASLGLLGFFPDDPCSPVSLAETLAGLGALAATPLALLLSFWRRNPQMLAAGLSLTLGIGSAGICLALAAWLQLDEFRADPQGHWMFLYLLLQAVLGVAALGALRATGTRFRLLAALAPWLVSALFLGIACGTRAEARTARLPANESSAVGSLRTVLTAAVTYETTYQNGFPPSLSALRMPGDGSPRCNAADLIDEWLAAGEKSGYRFKYTPGDAIERPAAECAEAGVRTFVVTARPLTYGRTGCRSFWMNEQGVIHFTRKDRPASPDDPGLQ